MPSEGGNYFSYSTHSSSYSKALIEYCWIVIGWTKISYLIGSHNRILITVVLQDPPPSYEYAVAGHNPVMSEVYPSVTR